jgi:hypothetical protein
MKTRAPKPAAPVMRYYVATYGDGGLEVEFFADPLAYGRAVKTAATLWEANQSQGGWKCDSYTNGKIA